MDGKKSQQNIYSSIDPPYKYYHLQLAWSTLCSYHTLAHVINLIDFKYYYFIYEIYFNWNILEI
jgi:hypothetical protein